MFAWLILMNLELRRKQKETGEKKKKITIGCIFPNRVNKNLKAD